MSNNFIEIAKKNFGNVVYDLSALLRCMDEAYNQAINDCIEVLKDPDWVFDEIEDLKKK